MSGILLQLRSVRRSLTTHALIQAFISCRLDYCNSVLAGVADVYLRRLRSVQNAAARLVSGLIATTTSRRFSLACAGFQCASESSTRRRCLGGSACTMQPLAIWLTCVCRCHRPNPCTFRYHIRMWQQYIVPRNKLYNTLIILAICGNGVRVR